MKGKVLDSFIERTGYTGVFIGTRDTGKVLIAAGPQDPDFDLRFLSRSLTSFFQGISIEGQYPIMVTLSCNEKKVVVSLLNEYLLVVIKPNEEKDDEPEVEELAHELSNKI